VLGYDMKNKRGSEMTIGTIIAIALGVFLLVFLIYGFSTQWNSFRGVLDPLSGSDSNVDNIARGCEVACASNNIHAYCNEIRTLNVGKGNCIIADEIKVKTESNEDECKSQVGSCEEFKNFLGVPCSICN